MNQEQGQGQNENGGGSNTTLIVILVIIGVLIVLGVVGRYAWSYVSDRVTTEVTQEATEEAYEQSTGTEVDVEEGQWPNNLDSNVQYPDSEVVSSTSFDSQEEGASTTVSLSTAAEVDEVYDYYLGLEDSGWEISYKFKSDRSDVNKTASVSMEKDSLSLAVSISREDESTTRIGITAITQ